MVFKFPTENGVGMVRGNQQVARECYLASMKQKAVDNIHMDELDMRDELDTRPTPSEELEPVQLDTTSQNTSLTSDPNWPKTSKTSSSTS